MSDPMESAKEGARRLEALGKRYGLAFLRAEESLAARWSKADWERAELEVGRRLEALAGLIGAELRTGKEEAPAAERSRRARLCVGLGSSFGVEIADPSGPPGSLGEMLARAGAAASFSSGKRRLAAMAPRRDGSGMEAFAHEWAHALDAALGRARPSRGTEEGARREALFEIERVFAGDSAAPTQELAAALLRVEARNLAREERGLSLAGLSEGGAGEELSRRWAGKARAALEPAARIVGRAAPSDPSGMSKAGRSRELALARSQSEWLRKVAAKAAEEDMEASGDFGAKISKRGRKALAGRLSEILEIEARAEASGRRSREVAFDKIKEGFAAELAGTLGLGGEAARAAADSIMRIEALKRREPDMEFAAPYTGRPDWSAPGSLHDIACALIRCERNAKALENPGLSKERHAPLPAWWLARSEISRSLLSKVPVGEDGAPRMSALAARYAGLLLGSETDPARQERILERAKAMVRWAAAKGESAFGAALYADLPGTGSRLAREEARLSGVELGDSEALSLQRRLAAPGEYLGAKRGIREAFAIGFERRVARKAREGRGAGAKAAAEMIRLGMAEDLGKAVAKDESAWMFGAGGRGAEDDRDWDALLGGLWAMEEARAAAERKGAAIAKSKAIAKAKARGPGAKG